MGRVIKLATLIFVSIGQELYLLSSFFFYIGCKRGAKSLKKFYYLIFLGQLILIESAFKTSNTSLGGELKNKTLASLSIPRFAHLSDT